MTRKLKKVLAVLGIGGFSLFQAGSCGTLAAEFLKDFENSYNSGGFGGLITGFGCDLGGDWGDWDIGDWEDDLSCELQ